MRHLWFAAASVTLSVAFLVPETVSSAILGWVGVFLLLYAVRESERPVSGMFLFGVILNILGFYWLPDTLSYFGGFPYVVSLLLCLLYAVVASLQFALCGWIYRWLRRTNFERFALAFPLAWLTCDLMVPQIFPWKLVHTQIAWTSLAGLAEFVGTTTLSALMLWCAEIALRSGWQLAFARKEISWQKAVEAAGALVLFAAMIVYSGGRNERLELKLEYVPKLRVALIQGNLDAKDVGDEKSFEVNIDTYRRLSDEAEGRGAQLVFWPESVMNVWTPETAEDFSGKPYNPYPETSAPIMYGTMSYRRRPDSEVQDLLRGASGMPTREEMEALRFMRFNSAFAVDEIGHVVGSYHKRALMPFGEYMPFGDLFPALKELSPHTGDFTPGDKLDPIEFDLIREKGNHAVEERTVRIMPLICYEDLIPELSRDAVRRGAELLVNLTNDAWYGDTEAPYQHHLLALWRAIETRRYLLRVTNTGFTAIVDPLGRTVASLSPFTQGTLLEDVGLLKEQTLYTKIGEIHNWVLAGITGVFLLLALINRSR